jgi:hypothetical protein
MFATKYLPGPAAWLSFHPRMFPPLVFTWRGKRRGIRVPPSATMRIFFKRQKERLLHSGRRRYGKAAQKAAAEASKNDENKAMTPADSAPNERGSKRRRTLSITDGSDQVPRFLEPLPPPATLETPNREVRASSSPLSDPPPESPSPTSQPYLRTANPATPDGLFVVGFDPTADDPFTDKPGSGSGTTSVGENGQLNNYRIPNPDVYYVAYARQRRGRNSQSPTPSRCSRKQTRSMTRTREVRRERARRFSAEVAKRHEMERAKFGIVEVEDMGRLSLEGDDVSPSSGYGWR